MRMRNLRLNERTQWLATAMLSVGLILFSVASRAQAPTPEQLQQSETAAQAQQRRQAERDAEQARQLRPETDVLRRQGTAKPSRIPADEKPCFVIHSIQITEGYAWLADHLAGQQKDDSPLGQCLGAQGVSVVLQRAQDALVQGGWVTSRVLAASQDLGTGQLQLTVVPGTLHEIHPDATLAPRAVRSAVPLQPGETINLRDIEQALENFQRAPTTQVDIQIAPASMPGQSDLVIQHTAKFPLRLSLSLDDAGSRSTGRYQTSATLSWDNPLDLNDLFYISQGNDAQGGDPGSRGNQSSTLHYSLPWGYWAFGFTMSESSYYQAFDGSTGAGVYSGGSGSTELKTSFLFHRNATVKSTVYLKALERHARNYVNQTEVLVQRRATALWELGLEDKRFLGQGTLQTNLAYKWGTHDFDAMDAPEEASGTGTARPTFYTADINWSTPWQAASLSLGYQASLRLQATDVALASPDRMALGGRHTVRGFDGENSISGDAGWLLRQELQWNLRGTQLYLALDAGEVDGPNATGLIDRFVGGTALGWRVQFKGLQLDAFVARPLHIPPTLRTSSTTAGFSLNYAL